MNRVVESTVFADKASENLVTTRPLSGSSRVYVQGSRDDIQVPMLPELIVLDGAHIVSTIAASPEENGAGPAAAIQNRVLECRDGEWAGAFETYTIAERPPTVA